MTIPVQTQPNALPLPGERPIADAVVLVAIHVDGAPPA